MLRKQRASLAAVRPLASRKKNLFDTRASITAICPKQEGEEREKGEVSFIEHHLEIDSFWRAANSFRHLIGREFQRGFFCQIGVELHNL